jgi:hypothetical protein
MPIQSQSLTNSFICQNRHPICSLTKSKNLKEKNTNTKEEKEAAILACNIRLSKRNNTTQKDKQTTMPIVITLGFMVFASTYHLATATYSAISMNGNDYAICMSKKERKKSRAKNDQCFNLSRS